MAKPRVHIFFATHMGYGQKGLSRIAQEFGFSIEKEHPMSLFIFVNAKGTKFKVLACNGEDLGYTSPKTNRQIGLADLDRLSRVFGGKGINLPAAVKQRLLEELSPQVSKQKKA